MGGKHGKYVYIARKDGWYVKARVFKNKPEDDPDKYLVIGPKTKNPPFTFEIVNEDDLPDEVRPKLYEF